MSIWDEIRNSPALGALDAIPGSQFLRDVFSSPGPDMGSKPQGTNAGAAIGAPDAPDWLAAMVSNIPFLGGALRYINNPKTDVSGVNSVAALPKGLVFGGGQTLGLSTDAAGQVLGAASDADPSKVLTGPALYGLHAAGVGSQGDEWDKGLLGITGATFDKAGRLATYATVAGPDFLTKSQQNSKAWDLAFAGGGQNITFGEALLADQQQTKSMLQDPSQLNTYRQDLRGTWYGQAVSGALDFAMYAALDPTKGAGRAIDASRASKYVKGPAEADRYAKTLNERLPMKEDLSPDAAQSLTPTLAQKTLNAGKAFVKPDLMNDATVVGEQFASKARLDNVTDLTKIINEIDPRLGVGGAPPRGAIPAVAEMYADAARVTSDVVLQRQIKLNIDYALTGSSEAMNWLATNYPTIAAKGARVSKAPSEFSLLEDAMQGWRERDNIAPDVNGLRGGQGSFNLGSYISRHYTDPKQQAELLDYGQAIERVQHFRSSVWGGGPEGQAVEFGQVGKGVQVAPRTLEKLKTALNNKVLDEHVIQHGSTGRTIRVVRDLSQPGANGFISLTDPVIGSRQLAVTLRQFSDQVDGVSPAVIKGFVDKFVVADPASRGQIVRALNDRLLVQVGHKYSLTPDEMKRLLKDTTDAVLDGRQYASEAAKKAAKEGNPNVYLGDLGGTTTVLNAQYLATHLDQTAPLLDWRTADYVARSYRNGGSPAAKAALDLGARTFSAYHTVWKHAQLGRLGLVFRVLMDTDLRANAMIGSGALLMQGIRGALYGAEKHLGVGNTMDVAASALDRMQARQAAGVSRDLLLEDRSQLNAIGNKAAQAARAERIAGDLKRKAQSDTGQFHPMTGFYRQRAADAQALADRLRGDSHAVGNKAQPTGLKSMIDQYERDNPTRVGAALDMKQAAKDHLMGTTVEKSNATRVVTHRANGIEAPFAPIQSELEHAVLPDLVRGTEGAGLSNLLLSNIDSALWKGRIERGRWTDALPANDLFWHEGYARAVQELRGSYTATRMLREMHAISDHTPEQVLRSYTRDPGVVNEFTNVMGGGNAADFHRWLSDLATSVKSMAPSDKIRAELLKDELLTPERVDSLIPKNERFDILSPSIVRDSAAVNPDKVLGAFYKHMVDLPDVYLARVPSYVGLYHRAVNDLLPGFAEKAKAEGREHLTAKEAAEVHNRAKQRALNDTRRDMYDVSRRIGAHGAMRYIAPFFNPWFDAIESWSRLIYDNPATLGQLMRYANTPDMFGITVDRDGKPVAPWDGTSIQDKFIRVPLAGIGGLENFRLGFGSMNTISQGNNPFSPGMGPLAQIAATELVTNVLPDFAPDVWKWMAANPNNLFSQTFFMRPGDIPKGDFKTVLSTQLPSWVRTASDVFLGENGVGNVYSNAFGTRYNDLIRQWRTDHGGADPDLNELRRLRKEAENGAKAAAATRAAVSFGLGLSGNASPQGQYYVDKMHSLVAAAGELKKLNLTPEQVFASQYPNASNLNWSFSINEGHLTASVNATTNYIRNQGLMKNSPDVQWWIAGPDNIVALADPNNQFSQGAYNQQLTLGLRKKMSEEDFTKQTAIAMGQGKMNAFNNALRLYMAQQGISSLNSKDATSLRLLKSQYVDTLRNQFPEWAAYYDSLNSVGLRDRQITQIKQAMSNAGRAFNARPDVVTTKQYLTARDAVAAMAESQGIKGWQNANAMAPQRALLYAYGEQLAAKDVVFAQAWSRLFEREFGADIAKSQQATMADEYGNGS